MLGKVCMVAGWGRRQQGKGRMADRQGITDKGRGWAWGQVVVVGGRKAWGYNRMGEGWAEKEWVWWAGLVRPYAGVGKGQNQ